MHANRPSVEEQGAFTRVTLRNGLLLGMVAATALRVAGADVDVTKLPPPAAHRVVFASEIKPIFEKTCLRCHGTERPKSRFSLATREGALKGGENGVDIIAGDSGKSRLIHYVARLVPDMEMPPEGKGDPLTQEQVALLRAWIDQGAAWEPLDAQSPTQIAVTPGGGAAMVSGNAQKFQEHQWMRRDVTVGAADFHFGGKLTNGAALTVDGRALTDDYRVTLDVRKEETGFARFGFEQFRHYYDDRGPYFPFGASGFATLAAPMWDLHRDLHVDTGRAFAELGVTRPDWPRITVGYEYRYKEGSKSTEQWGPVSQTTGGTNLTRNIFPAFKEINEDVHIVRLDVAYDMAGIALEDNMRAEFSDLKTRRVNDVFFNPGDAYPAALTITRETHDQLQYVNALHGSRPINDWLLVSAGYLFTRLDADATFNQATVDGGGRPALGTFWSAQDIVLKETAHVVNLNAQGGPRQGFTAAVGLQGTFSDATGFGNGNLQEGDPNDPTFGTPQPTLVRSDIDRAAVQESVILRYTQIPSTALFADVRLKQERSGQFEEQTGGEHDFLRKTDAATDWQEFTTGFDVSPWRQLSFHASYKKRLHESEYDHDRDERPHGLLGQGYPAFIRSRDSDSDMVDARLVLRPATWLKTTLSYERAATGYETEVDPTHTAAVDAPGGRIFAGQHDSSKYSANLTLTPWQRFSVATTFSYEESRIAARDDGSPSVVPYRGDGYSVLVSGTFIVDRVTDLTGSYSYSLARYGQNNAASGLPLGLDYDMHGLQVGVRRQFSTNISARVQYGFFDYSEPTSAHLNDYTAHTIFAMITIRLP